MKSIKENWEAFKEPAKQEGKNKGCLGCLWTVFKWGFVLCVVVTVLSECSNSPTEEDTHTNDPSAATVAVQNQQPTSAPTATTAGSQEENDALTEAPSAATVAVQNQQPTSAPTETTNGSQLGFLEKQIEYANKYNIPLHQFSAEEAALSNWLNESNENVVYLTTDNIFGADKYKITERFDGILYCGELKDNRPDGYGILLMVTETQVELMTLDDVSFVVRYIGQFSEGRFDGFGVMFTESESGYAFLSRLRPYDETTGENTADLLTWANYAEYVGEFSDGYKSGLGNHFYLADGYLGTFENALSEIDLDNPTYSIYVGNYKKDQLNGASKQYFGGYLYYDGNAKNDAFDGYGELYHLGTNILAYKGEFKNDMRHGTGTSYSETGEVVYQGEWKYDDYA